MVNVNLVTNNARKTVIVSEFKTVRQILNENEVRLNNAAVSIDGFTLGSPAELDKQLAEHTDDDTVTISVMVNKDNAAQAVVMASACIVKSKLTPEEIKTIKKFHPELLTLYDEDGNPTFAIDIDEEMPGSLNKYGACFGKAPSEDGKATITVVIDPAAEDPVKLVEDQFGQALLLLEELEDGIAEQLPTLREEERHVRSMITRL